MGESADRFWIWFADTRFARTVSLLNQPSHKRTAGRLAIAGLVMIAVSNIAVWVWPTFAWNIGAVLGGVAFGWGGVSWIIARRKEKGRWN